MKEKGATLVVGKPIAEGVVDEIRRSVDIVDLVSRYIPLHKAGKNLKALCPFHKEKTPSFVVNAERQTFHCFGCGEKGDVFTFVQKMERLASFPEAIEFLGRVAGIEVRRDDGASREASDGRREIYRLLEAAATYFRHLLLKPDGALAREYLRHRGVTEASEEAFRLGYALGSWDALRSAAARKGAGPELLIASGLAIQGDDRSRPPYDRFRNRLMFPIADAQARVIGFGGRVLDKSEPKYLNSPETPLFSKGQGLYGLDRARGAILESKTAIVVEGYTDVILAHQAGIANVVATLGTALTLEHARLLRRYATRVIVVYDGDKAGLAAAGRGVKVLLAEPLDIALVRLPDGLDPADAVTTRGGEFLAASIAAARDFFECVIEDIRGAVDMKTVSGRAAAADKLIEIAAHAGDPVRRDLLIRRISDEVGVSEDSLRFKLRGSSNRAAKPVSPEAVRPAPPAAARAETEILESVLNAPAAAARVVETLREDDFEDAVCREIFRTVSEMAAEAGELRRESLFARLSPAAADVALRLAAGERDPAYYERQAEGHIGFFERRRHDRDVRSLRDALRAVPASAEDDADVRKLLTETYEVLRRATIRPGSPRAPGTP